MFRLIGVSLTRGKKARRLLINERGVQMDCAEWRRSVLLGLVKGLIEAAQKSATVIPLSAAGRGIQNSPTSITRLSEADMIPLTISVTGDGSCARFRAIQA